MISNVKKVIKKIIPHSFYSPVRDAYRDAYKYAASFRYAGNKYECPFCCGHFSMFLPNGLDIPVLKDRQVIGGGYRLNSTCPRCFSIDRERLIYLYLKKVKKDMFSRNIKTLHVAPEKNLSLKLKQCPNIDYLSADLSSPLADLKMDITDIKKDNDTYDLIICNHVLEHIQDDAKAMRELYRVLKKGGFAILQVPISHLIKKTIEDPTITSPEERVKIFGQKDHVRIYGKDYTLRLKKVGFIVNTIDCMKEFDTSQILKYGLMKDEKIFICSK